MDRVLQYAPHRVTKAMNDTLYAPYRDVEVWEALKLMHPSKAPRPDGFNPIFFQQYWDIVGTDVCPVVLSVLHGDPMPGQLNHTNVVLIPIIVHPNNLANL